MKSKVLYIGCLLCCVFFYLWKKDFFRDTQVTVRCVDQAYACGDCGPRYKIKKISPASLKEDFISSEIAIKFVDTLVEDDFYDKVGVCSTCYEYELNGMLTRPFNKTYYVLVVETFKLFPEKR